MKSDTKNTWKEKVLNKNIVLIIPNRELLDTIANIFFQRGFSVFPFLSLKEVSDSLFKEENLFIWESDEIHQDHLEWIQYLNQKPTVKFILIDFLNDNFLLKLIRRNSDLKVIFEKSYKIRDLIEMSQMLVDKTQPFTNISSYIRENGFSFSQKLGDCENYLELSESIIKKFLSENNLESSIEDIDIFLLALGEVVENFVEYQLIQKKKKPDIIFEYALDSERIIVSVRDELGEADFLSLFKSFIRKTSITTKSELENYSEKGIYTGHRGRGMSIIKKGVDRLISIVKKQGDEYVQQRTQFIFILYLDKKRQEENSSINMLVFF